MENFSKRFIDIYRNLDKATEEDLEFASQACTRKIIFDSVDGKTILDEEYQACKKVTDAYRQLLISKNPDLGPEIKKAMEESKARSF